MFSLTNTGNVNLTGITNPVLTGTNRAEYTILFSSCGTGFLRTATLAPGAQCIVLLAFLPQSGDTVNSVRSATLSVTDLAGTQTSALTGTAK
jgi:hypothetical protein